MPFHHARFLYIEIYDFPYLIAALPVKDSTSLPSPFLQRLHNMLCHIDIPVRDFFGPCQLLWNPSYLYTSVPLPAYRLLQHTVCSNSSSVNELPPVLLSLNADTRKDSLSFLRKSQFPKEILRNPSRTFSDNQHTLQDRKMLVYSRFPEVIPR